MCNLGFRFLLFSCLFMTLRLKIILHKRLVPILWLFRSNGLTKRKKETDFKLSHLMMKRATHKTKILCKWYYTLSSDSPTLLCYSKVSWFSTRWRVNLMQAKSDFTISISQNLFILTNLAVLNWAIISISNSCKIKKSSRSVVTKIQIYHNNVTKNTSFGCQFYN